MFRFEMIIIYILKIKIEFSDFEIKKIFNHKIKKGISKY